MEYHGPGINPHIRPFEEIARFIPESSMPINYRVRNGSPLRDVNPRGRSWRRNEFLDDRNNFDPSAYKSNQNRARTHEDALNNESRRFDGNRYGTDNSKFSNYDGTGVNNASIRPHPDSYHSLRNTSKLSDIDNRGA